MMKTYKEIIETNNKYLKKNPKQKRYSFKSEYYNNFFASTYEKEPLQAINSLFDYGFVLGHKQAIVESKKADVYKLDLSKDVIPYKEKLLRLIYDMPWWSEDAYRYLYSFITCGMMPKYHMFPMSIGHELEIISFNEKSHKDEEIKKSKEDEHKLQLTEEEKVVKKALADAYSDLLKYSLMIKSPEIIYFLSRIAMQCVIDSGKEIASEECISLDTNMKQILDVVSWLYRMKDWKSVEILHGITKKLYNDEASSIKCASSIVYRQ